MHKNISKNVWFNHRNLNGSVVKVKIVLPQASLPAGRVHKGFSQRSQSVV